MSRDFCQLTSVGLLPKPPLEWHTVIGWTNAFGSPQRLQVRDFRDLLLPDLEVFPTQYL
jgi:hypothetical protein